MYSRWGMLEIDTPEKKLRAGVPEFRKKGSQVPFLPSTPDFRQDHFPILLQFVNESAGGPCLLVSRAPNEQIQEDRRQINSLSGQPVIHLPRVLLVHLRGDNSSRLKLVQTVGQNVRSDSFTRALELLECSVTADH